MPNAEGTGKRLVRRPHPPPTTAPLPDDFDAITETRDSTTIYDDATNSALGIDYDDITIAPAPTAAVVSPTYGRASAPPIHAPVPVSPPRNLTSPLRQQQQHRRPSSPSHSSIAALSPDARGSRRGGGGDGMSVGKARSVAGDRDRDRERATQRRSLGTGNGSVPMPAFPSGKGPAKGRNDLVEKLVIEDGPERTVSVWREHVAKNGEENGTTGGGGGGGGGGGDGDGRSDLDSHVGRRRVSTDSRRRVESLVQSTTGSPSMKGKGHRGRESAEFTEVSGPGSSPILRFRRNTTAKNAHKDPRSPSQHALPMRSSTPLASGGPSSQPTTPQKSQRRAALPPPTSPSVVGPKGGGTEYSASVVSDASTKVATHGQMIESVLSSCQPSLLHLLPILEELGMRRAEHMTALARMREETRDREVKEEALRKGITVVEWAILIDKLQSL